MQWLRLWNAKFAIRQNVNLYLNHNFDKITQKQTSNRMSQKSLHTKCKNYYKVNVLWVIHRHRIKVENVAVCRHHQKWKGKIQKQCRFYDQMWQKFFVCFFGIFFHFLYWTQKRLKSMDSNGNHSIHQSTVLSLGKLFFISFALLVPENGRRVHCATANKLYKFVLQKMCCVAGWREIRRKIVARIPRKCVILIIKKTTKI